MATTFKAFTKEDFDNFIQTHMKGAFKDITDDLSSSIQERVWEFQFSNDLSVRVFSGINRGDRNSRKVGEDAIRVIVFNRTINRKVVGSKRVNRTDGALHRMRDRCVELYKKFRNINTECPTCRQGFLIQRKSKRKRVENGGDAQIIIDYFYGCNRYPQCKHTQKEI